MISNITNALPIFLKEGERKENDKESDLIKAFKFFSSIFPTRKDLVALKHLHIDMVISLKDDKKDLIKSFSTTMDTLEFIKDLRYELDPEEGLIVVRGSLDDFAVLSLILLGSIKELKSEVRNKGIFITIAANFFIYCLNNGYNVCKPSDIKVLQEYNDGFEDAILREINVFPTPEDCRASFHFIGIPLTKDILIIFESFKNVKFTFNEQDGSYVITMNACDWDKFWKAAPKYLKDEFKSTNSGNIEKKKENKTIK